MTCLHVGVRLSRRGGGKRVNIDDIGRSGRGPWPKQHSARCRSALPARSRRPPSQAHRRATYRFSPLNVGGVGAYVHHNLYDAAVSTIEGRRGFLWPSSVWSLYSKSDARELVGFELRVGVAWTGMSP
jgi:hypothetical protein